MARSVSSDPLLSHNFSLLDIPIPALLPTAFPLKLLQSAFNHGSFIGFQSIRLPKPTIETLQIKEGNWPLVHSVLTGFTTTGEVTLEQAVLSTNVDMFFWFRQAMWGRIGPRRHFVVVQTRADKLIPQRLIYLEGCIPTSWSPGSDLDGGSTGVVTESLTMLCTSVAVIPLPIPTTANSAASVPGF